MFCSGANVFRGICLPSEAFQLYWLIGLTNPVLFCFSPFCHLQYCATLILKEQAVHLYQAWLSRPADHLWVPAPWCLMVPVLIPHILCSSEFSHHNSTTNLNAWSSCHRVAAPRMESETEVAGGRWDQAPAVANLL